MKNGPYPFNEIEPHETLRDIEVKAAQRTPDEIAYTFKRKKELVKISFSQLKNDVFALGSAFWDAGIKDMRIAVLGENSYEWVITFKATVGGGNVIVPIDKDSPYTDIEHVINESEAAALVFSDAYCDIAEKLKAGGSALKYYWNMKTDLPALIERGNELMKDENNPFTHYKVDPESMAAIFYTSGTTGFAKGVMLSHKNMVANMIATAQIVKLEERELAALPLHHSFTVLTVIGAPGVSVNVFINNSLKDLQKDITEFSPTITCVVPLALEVMSKTVWSTAKKQGKYHLLKAMIPISLTLFKVGIDIRRKLFKSVLAGFGGELKIIISGGAPLNPKLVKEFRAFGIDVLNGYGITECSPIVSGNRIYHYRDGSVGPVLPCNEVKIIDTDENGHGEICVKGDNVMMGYYKNEKATREAFDGEWFKTGDLGYVDKDGFLFITGRKKNLIILANGKNVQPEELEFAIENHIPYVKEVLVYEGDNKIVAEVFLDTENDPDCASRLDGDILKVNRTLAPYKNIGKTVIRDTEFPKTTTRKIKRQYGGKENA